MAVCRPTSSEGVENPFGSITDNRGDAYDIPIVGYGGSTSNFEIFGKSTAGDKFDLEMFNQGSYVEAVQEKAEQETITEVLYPNDSTEAGKELRLIQQYFFVSCSLQDIIDAISV